MFSLPRTQDTSSDGPKFVVPSGVAGAVATPDVASREHDLPASRALTTPGSWRQSPPAAGVYVHAANHWIWVNTTMNKIARIVALLATAGLLLSTVACGGAADGPKDAGDAAAEDGGKKMEKFEGNKMEKADEGE